MSNEDEARFAQIAQRSMWLVASCLAVVVLVMGVSIAALVGVASSAQSRANADAAIAAELQSELACRYAIAAAADTAQSHLISLVSFSVVVRARTDQSEMEGLVADIDAAVRDLEAATGNVSTAVDDCTVPPTP